MNEPRKPRRRWYQYSLRSLLLLMLLASIGMSYVAVRMQRARRQREAVQAIHESGGWVQYDYQVQQPGNPFPVPPGPLWLRSLLGDDFFATVVFVSYDSSSVTDADLEQLKGLTQLRTLALRDTKVTDAGLEHLNGLTQLQELYLGGTALTDAGLEHLNGLSRLHRLDLVNTQVTDGGMEHLTGLTQLQWLSVSVTHVTDAGLEHLKELTQLAWLDLVGTTVTDEGVKRLRQALPNCIIEH